MGLSRARTKDIWTATDYDRKMKQTIDALWRDPANNHPPLTLADDCAVEVTLDVETQVFSLDLDDYARFDELHDPVTLDTETHAALYLDEESQIIGLNASLLMFTDLGDTEDSLNANANYYTSGQRALVLDSNNSKVTFANSFGGDYNSSWLRNPCGWADIDGLKGAELLTNNDFDTDLSGWTAGTGWAWGDNGYTDGRAEHTTGNTAALSQAYATSANTTYVVIISSASVSGTSGSLTIEVDGCPIPQVVSDSYEKLYFYCTSSGTTGVTITPSSDYNGYISSVYSSALVRGRNADQCSYDTSANLQSWELRFYGTNLMIGKDAGGYLLPGTENNLAITPYGTRNITTGYRNFTAGTEGTADTLRTGHHNVLIEADVPAYDTSYLLNIADVYKGSLSTYNAEIAGSLTVCNHAEAASYTLPTVRPTANGQVFIGNTDGSTYWGEAGGSCLWSEDGNGINSTSRNVGINTSADDEYALKVSGTGEFSGFLDVESLYAEYGVNCAGLTVNTNPQKYADIDIIHSIIRYDSRIKFWSSASLIWIIQHDRYDNGSHFRIINDRVSETAIKIDRLTNALTFNEAYTWSTVAGNAGQVQAINASGVMEWITPAMVESQWSDHANGIYYSSGNVGIGIEADATYKLDVVGPSYFKNTTTYAALQAYNTVGYAISTYGNVLINGGNLTLTNYTMTSSKATVDGQVLKCNTDGSTYWATVSGGSSLWTEVTGGIYYNSGKVSINATSISSESELYVNGDAEFTSSVTINNYYLPTGKPSSASMTYGLVGISSNYGDPTWYSQNDVNYFKMDGTDATKLTFNGVYVNLSSGQYYGRGVKLYNTTTGLEFHTSDSVTTGVVFAPDSPSTIGSLRVKAVNSGVYGSQYFEFKRDGADIESLRGVNSTETAIEINIDSGSSFLKLSADTDFEIGDWNIKQNAATNDLEFWYDGSLVKTLETDGTLS